MTADTKHRALLNHRQLDGELRAQDVEERCKACGGSGWVLPHQVGARDPAPTQEQRRKIAEAYKVLYDSTLSHDLRVGKLLYAISAAGLLGDEQ